jgi:hypothetical protein
MVHPRKEFLLVALAIILDPLSNATVLAAYVLTPGFNQIGNASYIPFNLSKTSIADEAMLDTIPEVLSLLKQQNQRI